MTANPAFLVDPRGRCPRKYRANRLYEQMNDRVKRTIQIWKRLNQLHSRTVKNETGKANKTRSCAHGAVASAVSIEILRHWELSTDRGRRTRVRQVEKTSRVVTQVTNELVKLQKHFVLWPTTRDQKKKISNGFFRKRGMPYCSGWGLFTFIIANNHGVDACEVFTINVSSFVLWRLL